MIIVFNIFMIIRKEAYVNTLNINLCLRQTILFLRKCRFGDKWRALQKTVGAAHFGRSMV